MTTFFATLLVKPLVGAKISLRTFEEGDVTATYIGWLNDSQTVRFSNQRFLHHSLESARAYLATFVDSHNHFFAICDLTSGIVIGTLTVYQNRHHGTADIGIMIGDPASWGQGIGLDAFCTMVQELERRGQVRKLTAGAVSENKAMIRIMERAGFELEAVRRGQELLEGRPVDLLYYARFCHA
jgi:ribosomal-protein-alanine N-acetyltransferase